MLKLTRILPDNSEIPFLVNVDNIVWVQTTPSQFTTLLLLNGPTVNVKESIEEIEKQTQ